MNGPKLDNGNGGFPPFHFGKGGDGGGGDGGYFGSFFPFCMCIASGLSRGMVQEIKQALGWCNNHFDISYCYLIVFGLWCEVCSIADVRLHLKHIDVLLL